MKFEWDENKNQLNFQKHGIRFEDIVTLFEDPNRIQFQDLRKDYGETRWKTVGLVFGLIFSVTYTLRGSAIRLISARRASQKERNLYKTQ